MVEKNTYVAAGECLLQVSILGFLFELIGRMLLLAPTWNGAGIALMRREGFS